jgi:nitroreductase
MLTNPTLDLIAARKSLRSFAEQPVPPEVRAAILEAAWRAPTAGNMMLYAILEAADPALKEQLAHTCDDQPFIAKAPLVLVFLADFHRWHRAYLAAGVPELCAARGEAYRPPQEGDLFLAMCDALIAAQNSVIAAESLGLGSCYIGDILENWETHQALFELPRYVVPVTMVVYGYPKTAARGAPTRRYFRDLALHTDRYRPLTELQAAHLLDLHAADHPDMILLPGAENLIQHQYLRKVGAPFAAEMTRSVRAIIKAWAGG